MTQARVVASGRDLLALFAAQLRDADYTIGNLECPIATVGKPLESKIFAFLVQPPSVLRGRSLTRWRWPTTIRVTMVAPLSSTTMAHLDRAAIRHFGGGRESGAGARAAVDRKERNARRAP